MKKLLYAFALIGLFTFAAPIIANAGWLQNFCGHRCWCDDAEDAATWNDIYCSNPPTLKKEIHAPILA